MKAKDKAQQLIYAFEAFTDIDNELEFAKQCALIAVDEIISIKLLWYQKDTKELDYWQEVKIELQNL